MKRALVTGGSRGIGRAIADRLRVNNYDVLVIGKESEPENLHCRYRQADLSDAGNVIWISEQMELMGWDTLDVLVNNAGIAKAVKLEETTIEDMRSMFNVNVLAPFLLMQAAIPLMKANGSGSIVNITSISGLTGFSTMGAYCASKFALTGLSLVAAKELAKYKIRVNNVAPGPTQTAMWDQLDEEYKKINGWKDDTESEQAYLSKLLIKRLGNVEDVAAAVEFLVDENKSSYITGTTLKVCGGGFIG